MPIPITLADLRRIPEPVPLLVDVRKSPARAASGHAVPGSLRGDPADVDSWSRALLGRTVVVYCVHGHEVSQGVADRLTGFGVDCRYLVGGFAAWEAAGHPLEPIGADT
ncbi:MAG: rhodanese-like domain-containing protein [Mesorhizobium sp.]